MSGADFIQKELDWLERVMKVRFEFPKTDIFDSASLEAAIVKSNNLLMRKSDYDLNPPLLTEESYYSGIVESFHLYERLMLILSLLTHMEPGFIDRIIARTQYVEMIERNPGFLLSAGIVSKGNYGYLPTGRLWMYLIAGTNMVKRVELIGLLASNQLTLINSGLVEISYTEEHEPIGGGLLIISHSNLIKLLN